MGTLMLVSNPKRKTVTKGKRKMATRRHRTAAQKAATRKLVALNRARHRAAHHNPKPAKRRARRRSVVSHVAPTVRRYRRRATSAAKRHYRSARRSVMHGAGMGIVPLLKQAGIGAVGAVAVDIIYGKLPIPASMKVGYVGAAVKAAATIGLGMLASKVVNKQTAHGATVGALTVQLASIVKGLAGGMGLSAITDINGIDYYSPAMTTGAYLSDDVADGIGADGMGAYMSGYQHSTEPIY